MFETLSDRLTQVFTSLRGRGRLSAADIETTCREIRIALLEADVALPVAREFIGRVRERASSAEVSQALNPAQQVIKIVHEELIGILGGEARRLRFAKTAPTVIMLAGLQGSGKTTLAGKLALWLRGQGNTPMLVAADLQRPNAVQQLQVLGERAGTPVFAPEPGNGVGDPVAVARASIDEARRRLHNIVIIDTAGRLGIDAEMMAQAAAIRDAVDPDEILFVVDAMIGQDAVATAQAFLDGVGYDGVVLTKLDGDARGGAALSIAQLTERPIMFASIGEKLEDFDLFHPDRMASRILDLGDMLTLIEQAERAFDAEQAATMAGKLASGEGFTLEDFIEQLAMVRKLGPIGNLLGMLPGAAQNREMLSQISDKDLDRAAAIVNSMTPAERRNPKMLNGSRRARIAAGAGVSVGEVNNLVIRFLEGQKMMRQLMGRGGMPGMPGLPGMRRPGGKSAKGRKAAKKKPKGGRPGGAPARPAAGAGGRPAGGSLPDLGAMGGQAGLGGLGPGALGGGFGPGGFGAGAGGSAGRGAAAGDGRGARAGRGAAAPLPGLPGGPAPAGLGRPAGGGLPAGLTGPREGGRDAARRDQQQRRKAGPAGPGAVGSGAAERERPVSDQAAAGPSAAGAPGADPASPERSAPGPAAGERGVSERGVSERGVSERGVSERGVSGPAVSGPAVSEPAARHGEPGGPAPAAPGEQGFDGGGHDGEEGRQEEARPGPATLGGRLFGRRGKRA